MYVISDTYTSPHTMHMYKCLPTWLSFTCFFPGTRNCRTMDHMDANHPQIRDDVRAQIHHINGKPWVHGVLVFASMVSIKDLNVSRHHHNSVCTYLCYQGKPLTQTILDSFDLVSIKYFAEKSPETIHIPKTKLWFSMNDPEVEVTPYVFRHFSPVLSWKT